MPPKGIHVYSEVMRTLLPSSSTWYDHSESSASSWQDTSRKNSEFSVETSASSVYESEERGTRDALSSVWREIIRSSGLTTPNYPTWDAAREHLDLTLNGVLDGKISLVHSTVVGHAICVAAGYPAGSCATLDRVRHPHILVRDLGVLLHVTALRLRSLNDVAREYQRALHTFIEVAASSAEPTTSREFVIKTTHGTFVVDELGRIVRKTSERTHIVQAGGSVDYPYLSTLANSSNEDPYAVCQAVDLVDLAPLYARCYQTRTDPGLVDTLAGFLEARIRLHLHMLHNNDDVDCVAAVIQALGRLARYSHAAQDLPLTSVQATAIFSRSGTLRGGSKAVLVEHITRHDERPEIVHPFLITFSAFMTEMELLKLLMERYDVQPVVPLQGDDMHEWFTKVCCPIRARVVAVLRTWTSSYWLERGYEAEERPELERMLREFAEYTGNKILQRSVGQLLDGDVHSSASASTSGTATLSGFASRVRSNTSEASPYVAEPTSLQELSPGGLAAHITHIKSRKFAHVTHQCFLWRQIGRISDHADTPLNRYINHWNQETNWVSASIIGEADLQTRARRLEYFIDAAQSCRELQNFSSLMAFISAFSSAGLYRLKSTWALVSEQHTARLAALAKLMESNCNFNNYRDTLWHVQGPCIPFVGLCLMDLQYTFDGNNDFFAENSDMINFSKWSVTAGIIDSAVRFRAMEYDLEVFAPLVAALENAVSSATPLSEQYEQSLHIEERIPRVKSATSTSGLI